MGVVEVVVVVVVVVVVQIAGVLEAISKCSSPVTVTVLELASRVEVTKYAETEKKQFL